MKKRTSTHITLLGACLAGLVACERVSDQIAEHQVAEHQGARTGPAATPRVEPPPPQVVARNAAESIAASRCERETTCNNVGDFKKYSSNQDCLDRVRANWKDELSLRQCPSGVNDAQLDQCLAKIRSEKCDSPLDSLARIVECGSGQVCQA